MGSSRFLLRAGLLGTLVLAMLALCAPVALAQTESRPQAIAGVCPADPHTSLDVTPTTTVAQTFTAGRTGDLSGAEVYVRDLSNFDAPSPYDPGLVVEIRTVNEATGEPTDVVLATTEIPASRIYDWGFTSANAYFDANVALVKGTRYALALTATEGRVGWGANTLDGCPGIAYTSTAPAGFTPARESNELDMNFRVYAFNDRPVAVDDSYSMNENGTLSVPAPGVLGNDTDAENDPLSAFNPYGQPPNGTLNLAQDGSFTYTPNADFVGTETFGYSAQDGTSADGATVTITVEDATAPTITATKPANKATGVRRGAPLTATFSERMNPDTLTKATFKLYKVTSTGSKQVANTTVGLGPDGLVAPLDPFGDSATVLAKNTKYKAVVTTGAMDTSDNALDQNPAKAGGQQKVWTFTTGKR